MVLVPRTFPGGCSRSLWRINQPTSVSCFMCHEMEISPEKHLNSEAILSAIVQSRWLTCIANIHKFKSYLFLSRVTETCLVLSFFPKRSHLRAISIACVSLALCRRQWCVARRHGRAESSFLSGGNDPRLVIEKQWPVRQKRSLLIPYRTQWHICITTMG